MIKSFRHLLANRSAIFVLALVLVVGVVVASTKYTNIFTEDTNVSIPPERQKALAHQLVQDCGSCHGLTMKGGLGPPLRPQDLEGKDDEALVDVILDGIPGTPMPPWRFEITPIEALWLVQIMKEGKFNAP